MESNEEKQQLEEIKAQLRRAERVPVRTSAVRKETLKRLIDLAHSPYTSLKSFAANNFKHFIKDFPELEDDAINAVYDLCEDPSSKVRIDGYYAIIQVSKEQKKWVKRNADVLVQLLQSDEPDEVTVVKKALTEHLDMDPVVTLGVLCDQIIPLEEILDEEDQMIRDRLRSLVLAFIIGEAKRAIVERHANTYKSAAEEVLVDGLLKAIKKPNLPDIDIIVKDVLLSLPSFSRFSTRGSELLDTLLTTAKVSLKADLASQPDTPSPLPQTLPLLNLASYIALEKRVAYPVPLLRFYCSNLISKMTFIRLTEETQNAILDGVGGVLEGCEKKEVVEMDTNKELPILRKQVVEASSVLLSSFTSKAVAAKRPWRACETLLRACAQRKRESHWTIHSPLSSTLQKIQQLSSQEKSQDSLDQASIEVVHNLIRSLLQDVNVSPTSTTNQGKQVTNSPSSSIKASGQPVIIKRKREEQLSSSSTRPSSLPPKPPPSIVPPSTPSPAPQGQRSERQQRQGYLQSSNTTRAKATSSTSRATNENGISSPSAPSLLSRLGGGESSKSSPSSPRIPSSSSLPTPSAVPHKRRADDSISFSGSISKRPHRHRDDDDGDVDMDKVPVGGFSIKGAASRLSSGDGNADGTRSKDGGGRQSSLLDRMRGSSAGDDSGSEKKGRRRTRN